MDEYEKTISCYEEKKIKKENNESFYLTIINNDKIEAYNLNEFNSSKVTFGRKDDNDIVIDSMLVSGHHGYFNIVDDEIYIIDDDSTNGIFYNGKTIKEQKLSDRDIFKIDNPKEPLNKGVMFVLSLNDKKINWDHYDLSKKDITIIGRDSSCDIVLKHIGVSKKHAIITKKDNQYFIKDNDSTNNTSVNGEVITNQIKLKEKDVILITNSLFIYSFGRLIYQTFNEGVKVEAYDIVKTVATKDGTKDILKHISLEIKPANFVALVGGSGAGKSTFMNSISGFSKPTSGNVLVNGVDLYDNYSVLKNIIGYVPQQDIVYTNLRLYDMLKYAADLRMPEDSTLEEKEIQIAKVLDIVDLTEHKDTYIRKLSGGQRKRASIAVELIADPTLFFLDEPTSGLDPGTERSIMKTLKNMSESGKTVILVTHTTLNLHLCDMVVFIGRGGKLCFAGKPSDGLKFFGVSDFVDIYTYINNDSDNWNNKFLNSEYYNAVNEKQTEKVDENANVNKKSFMKQLITLTARYLKLIVNDKQRLALLLLQAQIISFLLSLVTNSGVFKNYDDTKAILFSLACSCIWLGILNSIQEICKEKVILKKEYMADLKLSSYICSKLIVQSLLAFIQSFILITVYAMLVEFPAESLIINPYFDFLIISTITIISAASLGILISSIVKDANIAMSVAPLILVPQLLFSGMLFELKEISSVISNFVLCRFSVSALGTTLDLNKMPNKIFALGFIRDAEDYFTYTSSHYFNMLLVLIGMSVLMIIVSYVVLKKELDNRK